MNSQDRELLELAAKAGGITGEWCEFTIADTGKVITGIGDPCSFRAYGDRLWNPLDDDGDAFRLGVRLGLMVDLFECASDSVEASFDDGDYSTYCSEPVGEDKAAATRRAIVRVAADISRKT